LISWARRCSLLVLLLAVALFAKLPTGLVNSRVPSGNTGFSRSVVLASSAGTFHSTS
jgi:hypothetical protein